MFTGSASLITPCYSSGCIMNLYLMDHYESGPYIFKLSGKCCFEKVYSRGSLPFFGGRRL